MAWEGSRVSSSSSGSSNGGPVDQRQPLDDHQSQRCHVLMRLRNCRPEDLDADVGTDEVLATGVTAGIEFSQRASPKVHKPVIVDDVRAMGRLTHRAQLNDLLLRPNGFTALMESDLNLYKLWCKLPDAAPEPQQQPQQQPPNIPRAVPAPQQQAQSISAVASGMPLVLPGLGSWQRWFDNTSGRHYWINVSTRESYWEHSAQSQLDLSARAAGQHLPDPVGGRQQPQLSPWAEPPKEDVHESKNQQLRSPLAEPLKEVLKSSDEPSTSDGADDPALPSSREDVEANVAPISPEASGTDTPQVVGSARPGGLILVGTQVEVASAARDPPLPTLTTRADDKSAFVPAPQPLQADEVQQSVSSGSSVPSFLPPCGDVASATSSGSSFSRRGTADLQELGFQPQNEDVQPSGPRGNGMRDVVDDQFLRQPISNQGTQSQNDDSQYKKRPDNWMRDVMDDRALRQPRLNRIDQPQNGDVQVVGDVQSLRQPQSNQGIQDVQSLRQPQSTQGTQSQKEDLQNKKRPDNWMRDVMDDRSLRQPRRNRIAQPQNDAWQPRERSDKSMIEVMGGQSLHTPPRSSPARDGGGHSASAARTQASDVADDQSLRHGRPTAFVEEAKAAADTEKLRHEELAAPSAHTLQNGYREQPSRDGRPALWASPEIKDSIVESESIAARSPQDPTPVPSPQDDDDTSSVEEGAGFWYC